MQNFLGNNLTKKASIYIVLGLVLWLMKEYVSRRILDKLIPKIKAEEPEEIYNELEQSP